MNNSISLILHKKRFLGFLLLSILIHFSAIFGFYYFVRHLSFNSAKELNTLSFQFVSFDSPAGLSQQAALSTAAPSPSIQKPFKLERSLKQSAPKETLESASPQKTVSYIQDAKQEPHLTEPSNGMTNYGNTGVGASSGVMTGKEGASRKDYQKLLSQIRKKIESNKHYPEDAKKKGIEGKVSLRFEVLENGSLKFVELFSSSGFPSLDQAAKKAVMSSAPFPYYPGPVRLSLNFELEE